MANGHGISRSVKRRFLHLAAIAFALGAESALADGSGSEAFDDGECAVEALRAAAGVAAPVQAICQYVFRLGAPAALPHPAVRAQVRVLDAGGAAVLQLPLHGPAMVGPLPAGPCTVLVKIDGLTEVQQLRIGAGVGPWLHFREPA